MATRSLGTLTLDLVAKIGGFVAGMDKASRVTDKRMREMEKRAKALGRDIGIALSAIGSVAVAGMTLYLKNTIEAEKVQAQLTARIKDTGGAAGQSLKSLNDMADALQSMTTFDDEAIGGVQAMLLTFKDIKGDNFRAATEAVLDLSTAMGTDLNSAALQIGKALQDPVKGISALSRAGVQFTEDQKKVIKALVETGDKAGAQKIILDELAGQMGTAAEAARNTLGGALQALKNSFDNLLEGDVSEGGLRGTRNAIENLNSSLNDPGLKRGIDSLASGLLSAANAAIEAAGKLGSFIASYKDFLANKGFLPANQDTSLKDLVTRRQKLVDTLNKQGPSNLISGASDPISKALGIDKKVTDGLKQQIAEVDGLIAAKKKQEADFAKFRGLPENFGLNVNPNGSSGASPAKPATGVGASRSAARAGKTDAAKEAEEAAKAARELLDAQQDYHSELLDMQADMAGPIAQANREYDKQMSELEQNFQQGKVTLSDYATAQELLTQKRDQDVAAIKAQLTPAEQLLADMQAEYDLIGMTDDERVRAIALRYAGADATDAERQAIGDLAVALERAHEAQAQIDDLKDASKDFFVDLADGAGSAREAWDDFFDGIKRRALEFVADKVINQFFDMLSGKGSSSGGSSGGGFWAGLAGLFGGGGFGGEGSPLAGGGWTDPMKYHQVGEYDRPELLLKNGKQYLLPGDRGRVVPMGDGGGGFSQTVNFLVSGRIDNRTQSQTAQKQGDAAREAMRRNGGRG